MPLTHLSPRMVKLTLIITMVAALLSLFLSLVNMVQAENTRDQQARELVLLHELEEVEARIDRNTAGVAAFVEQVRTQQATGPSPATQRIYSLVEAIARSHGLEVPPPPTTPTTRPG